MTVKQVIKTAMVQKNIKSGEVADAIGMEKGAFYNWLSRPDVEAFEKLNEIADAIGCEVALVDKASGKVYK